MKHLMPLICLIVSEAAWFLFVAALVAMVFGVDWWANHLYRDLPVVP